MRLSCSLLILLCCCALPARPALAFQEAMPGDTTLAQTAVSDTTAAKRLTAGEVFAAAGGFRWIIMSVAIVGLLLVVGKALELRYDWRESKDLYLMPLAGMSPAEINVAIHRNGGKHDASERSRLGDGIWGVYKAVTQPFRRKKQEAQPESTLLAGALDTLMRVYERGNTQTMHEEIDFYLRFHQNRFEIFRTWMTVLSDAAGGLGLLGTVWGMFRVFFSGELDREIILAGMGIALITTLLGLGVSLLLDPLTAYISGRFNKRMELVVAKADRLRFQLMGMPPTATGAPGAEAPQQAAAGTPAPLNPETSPPRFDLVRSRAFKTD